MTAEKSLNDTPRGNRIHIAFFGLRNAGKSTLVNVRMKGGMTKTVAITAHGA